jgi:hypothetical protein
MECVRFTGALDWTLQPARTFAMGGTTQSGAEAHALHVLARSSETKEISLRLRAFS